MHLYDEACEKLGVSAQSVVQHVSHSLVHTPMADSAMQGANLLFNCSAIWGIFQYLAQGYFYMQPGNQTTDLLMTG